MTLIRALLFALMFLPAAAQAQVIAAFWSQDTGEYFPHAYVSLKGELASGQKIDDTFGFTVKSLSPAILLGSVPGRVDDDLSDDYVKDSDVWFEVELSDAQVRDLFALKREWAAGGEASEYRLNSRNCVHFAAEAMRRAGLRVEEPDGLMKKPKSFTRYIASLNEDRITPIGMKAEPYFAFVERRERAWAAAAAANDNRPVAAKAATN